MLQDQGWASQLVPIAQDAGLFDRRSRWSGLIRQRIPPWTRSVFAVGSVLATRLEVVLLLLERGG